MRRGTQVCGDQRIGGFLHTIVDDLVADFQTQDQLLPELSATDVNAYVATGYFRLSPTRYFVPLSLVQRST